MFKKSFESITAPLRKMVQDLRKHAEDKHTEAKAHEARANELVLMHNDCVDEADVAMETADNLANLLGEPTESQQ